MDSCSSGQEQLAGFVLLALTELESAKSCSGQVQSTGVLLALSELELVESGSAQEQLAGFVLALARVDVWKEEAAAVKRKSCISFRCSFTNASRLTSRNIAIIGAGIEIGYLDFVSLLSILDTNRKPNLWCCRS